MVRLELSRDLHLLPHQIRAGCEGVPLRSPGQSECVVQSGYINLQGALALGQGATRFYKNLGCRKPCVLDRFGDFGRVKGFSGLGENLRLALHQIYISMINAIQALQGFLRPFRSKASYHAVDFDCGFFDLR